MLDQGDRNNRDRINEYLWFGYRISDRPADFLLNDELGAKSTCSHSAKSAKTLISNIIGEIASTSRNFIVPISGGWDSRLLLAELCTHVPRSRIRAVTFGVPGALDFELGTRVARALGVVVERVDLSAETVDWETLKEFSRIGSGVPPTLSGPNLSILKKAASSGEEVLSGFVGDLINGGHERSLDGKTGAKFFRQFAEERKFCPGTELFSSSLFFPTARGFSGEGFGKGLPLAYGMFVWFRVQSYTAPAILGSEMSGWASSYPNPFDQSRSVYTPFTDRRWVSFWMDVPREARLDQKLFFEMLRRFYPDICRLPSKDGRSSAIGGRAATILKRNQHRVRNRLHKRWPGLPIRSVLMDNYLDVQAAFRQRADYADVLERGLENLKRDRVVPWIDVDRLWHQHYSGERDHSKALQLLLGLALDFENREPFGNG